MQYSRRRSIERQRKKNMSPPPPRAESSASGCGKVWVHNQKAEQARILALVREFPIVAVKTSHDVPAQRTPPATPPGILNGSYEAVRASVESMRSAQLGLALANSGRRARVVLAALSVEPGTEPRRADPRGLCAALRVWCAIDAWPNGVLVTRDGAEDVAYVVRHLRGEALLPVREEFLQMCNAAFPALYDLKVMAEWATLNKEEAPLAGARRDAFRGFLALVRGKKHGGILDDYNAFLFGVGVADTMELMRFKKTIVEDVERLRQMKELFRKLYPGHDPEYPDRLPLC
ncbi:hypothetical protein HU200_019341 [Digitaria exilis]|uniref:Uncharacterized protein n=1 Tax=Digitaria exilis TaxID=1010633 RepID=A0A835F321_9POAL|nr:hypothetical protein HU200_019341 [Digitaria exilis]